MTNLTGRTLSHYRLEAKIGSGGMGEVYRGTDLRLDRPVAVKILPPDLLHDDDRRRRFTQEAKAASALNHPNIVTIHDVGSEAGIDLIVMEHVAGKTLEEIIGRRPMAIGPLLKYATQVADALSAAHAAGIVHRDLKPTNIMVTDQGLVKVLDFGLAKLAEAEAPANEHTHTAAQAGSPTKRGTIVGTASYMSPEQAEGGVVDARSDIFSFGSVLYEMATGRRAFDGSTTMSTIAAVLRDDPPRPSTITGPLPHDLEVLINRCLKKDPSRRVQHMADLKVALQELKEDSESGRLMTTVAAAAPPRRPLWAIVAAAVTGLAAVAAVAGWFMFRGTPETPQPAASTRLTFDRGTNVSPVLSPDGKLVAYSSTRSTKAPNIWIQQVDGGDAVQLTNYDDGAVATSFSPDGTRIAYVGFGKDEGVYVVSTVGRQPRKIAPAGAMPRFSPDGSQLVVVVGESTSPRLMLVPAAGGQPTNVPGDFFPIGAAMWLDDGTHLLAAGWPRREMGRVADMDWFAISVRDGTAVPTGAAAAFRAQKLVSEMDDIHAPEPGPGGTALFVLPNGDALNVWRVAVNPTTFQVKGPAERLTSGATKEVSPTMSRDGTLAFSSIDLIEDFWSLPIDANAVSVTGRPTQIMKNSASDNHSLTLDGTTLFYCSHRGNVSEIHSRDLRTGKETLLMSGTTLQHVGSVTADGTKFIYHPPTDNHVRFLATTSGAAPRKICEGCNRDHMSSDGSKLLYLTPPDFHTIRVMDIASGQAKVLLSSATKEFYRAQFSPDARWAALATVDARHLLIVPVRDSKVDEKDAITITRPTASGGYQIIRFSPDGNTIYYLSNEDGHGCIYAQRLTAAKQPAGAPVAVQHLHDEATTGHPHAMRVGADKIVLLMAQTSSTIWVMRPRQ